MKYFKKMIIIFTLLICVIPNNIVKADEEDIMLTVVVGYCTRCYNDALVGEKQVHMGWAPSDDDIPCIHNKVGHDTPKFRICYYHYICSNCGYTFDSELFREEKLFCYGV